MSPSKSGIPVPLFDLKVLDGVCRLRCKTFKSAALACEIMRSILVGEKQRAKIYRRRLSPTSGFPS